jgi:hypothetical protein
MVSFGQFLYSARFGKFSHSMSFGQFPYSGSFGKFCPSPIVIALDGLPITISSRFLISVHHGYSMSFGEFSFPL